MEHGRARLRPSLLCQVACGRCRCDAGWFVCGIVGIQARNGSPAAIESCVSLLAHRGPDDRGTYADASQGVALGHTRLSILDLSAAGHQPMLSPDGQVALVYNGEIYNFRELRAELEGRGVAFRSGSDTEVLLHWYLQEGMAMLSRLNGIFAFALHDRRSGEVLLARDALGVKPLYVAEGSHGVAFASEIKALLPLVRDEAKLDPRALHRYLSFLWCPGDGTPLAGVRKLGPGEAAIVKEGRIAKRWTWYELPARRGTIATLGREEAIAVTTEGLRTAVHRQLVADVPVGAFLSGGLDSSAIVAFARERVSDLCCFTIESPGGRDAGEADDLPYAKRVAQHLGVRLDVVNVDAGRMAGDLEAMVRQLDEPLADPAPLNVLYISRLARENGMKVLLSGAGGDDLFSGYRRHLAIRYQGVLAAIPQPIRSGLAAVARRLDQRGAVGRRASRLFANADESPDRRLAGYFAWAREGDLLSLYSADMRAAVAGIRADQPLVDFLAGIPAGQSRLDRALALEQRFFLADHNLTYTDKMSMAAGVEVRVPFLDLELVELAARIPDRFKQRGRTGKWVLKKAMEPFLPRDVIYRPKTGFGAPLRRWMRHELRELLRDLLSEQSLRRRGIFDPAAVQRLIADNEAGRKDAAYTLLSLLCIEIWCRAFLSDTGVNTVIKASA